MGDVPNQVVDLFVAAETLVTTAGVKRHLFVSLQSTDGP